MVLTASSHSHCPDAAEIDASAIGVVIIGRNEGDRLIRGLQSVLAANPSPAAIVYVDSGSTDGSLAAAKRLGVHALALDMSEPFTMARGRNAGWRYLLEQYPHLDAIQFMDGDCELLPGWLEAAVSALASDPQLAAVCGRRQERFPEASVYNQLADLEWNTPVGEARACGGDALFRAAALKAVDGYRPDLICGEEPEMCIRLRQRGWKIRRIDAAMTLHDAAMVRFAQWWKRSVRGGWAVAEGYVLHGRSPEAYMAREHQSGWLWGGVLPLTALACAPVTRGLSLVLLLLGYFYLSWRIYQYRIRRGDRPGIARLYAGFCTLSKLPQALGQLSYYWHRWRGKQATLIEYKGPGESPLQPPLGDNPALSASQTSAPH